jgi:UDP-galactopyranose mutase
VTFESFDKILIVGAGISGATLARCLAEAGFMCIVADERDHVAGNCHTATDDETGILVHRYGPHIFHTDDDEVWRFVNRFASFSAYRHQVMTTTSSRVFQMPITLLSINQFFGKQFNPETARQFVASKAVPHANPASFEDHALSVIGPELYEAFLRDYTWKQWGQSPASLPASVAKRLPIRFDYDSNYFHHSRQAMPTLGYTNMVLSMLDHPKIRVQLSRPVVQRGGRWRHQYYTGPIDRYFDFCHGRLGYRTLDFEVIRSPNIIQGTSVMNYGDMSVPWTRITEHAYLSPWAMPLKNGSIAYREFARACGPNDIPYYPVRLVGEQAMLQKYVETAEAAQGVTFLGRLGSYAYLDMDAAIARALEVARLSIASLRAGHAPPVFAHRPI